MAALRQRAWAVAVVALVAAVIGLFLTVWRPRYQPSTQKLPSAPVPYNHVQFTISDAKRAFAAVGVRLVPKSRVPGVVTTIGTRRDEFEVDIFGDPTRVNGLGGSPDLTTDAHGNYVRIPSTCTPGIPDAERWRANVRFVVSCANTAHAQLLSVGARALANL
jgi:hypothetical protein